MTQWFVPSESILFSLGSIVYDSSSVSLHQQVWCRLTTVLLSSGQTHPSEKKILCELLLLELESESCVLKVRLCNNNIHHLVIFVVWVFSLVCATEGSTVLSTLSDLDSEMDYSSLLWSSGLLQEFSILH
jgi:hypothetical protein